MSSNVAFSVRDLEAMDDMEVTGLIVEKLIKHMPCLIRFNRKAQDSSSPGYDEHTGILFGCHFTAGNFEFGIYFKDPLSTDIKLSRIQLVEKSKRVYKVFAGAAFIMTCYYHWDKNGTLSSSTPYTRTFYIGADVQCKPNSEGSWVKMGDIFPSGIRSRSNMKEVQQFLAGEMDDRLPVPNESLRSILDPSKCHPRQFHALTGRRKLMGRGPARTEKKTTKIRASKKRKSIEEKYSDDNEEEEDNNEDTSGGEKRQHVSPSIQINISPSCPGCECQLTDRWILDPSQYCCGIEICQSCADTRSSEWKSDTQKSCFGSWIQKRYCRKYVHDDLFSDILGGDGMNSFTMVNSPLIGENFNSNYNFSDFPPLDLEVLPHFTFPDPEIQLQEFTPLESSLDPLNILPQPITTPSLLPPLLDPHPRLVTPPQEVTQLQPPPDPSQLLTQSQDFSQLFTHDIFNVNDQSSSDAHLDEPLLFLQPPPISSTEINPFKSSIKCA
jgi:hypothetical protein